MILGGGVTGDQQVCDTTLNQPVRRKYGFMEANSLVSKMQQGDPLPTSSEEDSMSYLHHIWSDEELHKTAAYGFKEAGLSVDLEGREDCLIAKGARDVWYSPTYEGCQHMRAKLDVEIAYVKQQVHDQELPWGFASLMSLVEAYPSCKDSDPVLARQGCLAGHIAHYDHGLSAQAGADVTDDASSSDSEPELRHDENANFVGASPTLAVPSPSTPCRQPAAKSVASVSTPVKSSSTAPAAPAPIPAHVAKRVQQLDTQMAGLEVAALELSRSGNVYSFQKLETDMNNFRRQRRCLARDSDAVAERFRLS